MKEIKSEDEEGGWVGGASDTMSPICDCAGYHPIVCRVQEHFKVVFYAIVYLLFC